MVFVWLSYLKIIYFRIKFWWKIIKIFLKREFGQKAEAVPATVSRSPCAKSVILYPLFQIKETGR